MWIGIAIGLVVGCFCGVTTMCMVQINRDTPYARRNEYVKYWQEKYFEKCRELSKVHKEIAELKETQCLCDDGQSVKIGGSC